MSIMALNNTGSESKYNVSIPISGSTGVLASSSSELIPCHIETQLRVEITGVGPTNEIQLYGRIRSSELWHYIATVTGPVTGIADISTYDFIRYFVTVADGAGTLAASGFIFSKATTTSSGDGLIGGLVSNISYDEIVIEYPTTTTETYKYYLNTIKIAEILIEYIDATKSNMTRARRSL